MMTREREREGNLRVRACLGVLGWETIPEEECNQMFRHSTTRKSFRVSASSGSRSIQAQRDNQT